MLELKCVFVTSTQTETIYSYFPSLEHKILIHDNIVHYCVLLWQMIYKVAQNVQIAFWMFFSMAIIDTIEISALVQISSFLTYVVL